MRVAVDVSPLVQTRAGTARYIRGLLPELRAIPDVELTRLSFGRGDRLSTVLRDVAWYPALLARRAVGAGADVLHCPSFRAPVGSRVPLVVTVHDLAVLRLPEAFNAWSRRYSRLLVPRVVRAARRIIAVSEFTRRELLELCAVSPERIRVIPNAVDEPFTPEGPRAEGDYVLAVGTLEPRKNLHRLVEAADRAGVRLHVVGARGWGGVDVAPNGAVRWLGEVADGELAALYRGALCVAYPSLYEGFGIPVLEAMACGTPVVTSAGSAMEEVAGDAAVLVDPLDPGSIAAGMEEAIARREELARRGLARARHYSWSSVAAATADVYREAA